MICSKSFLFCASLSQAVRACNPNWVPRHFAGWMRLCRAHVLWMKWFVFLITASHPFPLRDIQINTLPLAIVLFTLVPASQGSLLSVVLISPGSFSYSCPCVLFSFFPFCLLSPCPSSSAVFPFNCRPLCGMPAGVSVLVSKYCHGSGSPSLMMRLTSVTHGQDSPRGILGYNSGAKWGPKFVKVLKSHP